MNYNRPCGCAKPAPVECNGTGMGNAGCGCKAPSCGCNTAASMPSSSCGCGCNTAASMPACSCGCSADFPGIPCETKPCCVDQMTLGMSYVPMQTWQNVYNACEGLKNGSIFRDLIYPFHCTGCNAGRRCR